MRKVLEERILENRVELSLRKVLGITKEFHTSIVDLVKRKRLAPEPEPEPEKPVEVRMAHLDDAAIEDDWRRAIT